MRRGGHPSGEFGHGLQIEVDRKLEILAGDGGLVADHLPRHAELVHDHLALAVHSHQLLVVLALHTLFADDIAGFVVDELGRIELRFADFTDVADHVRREAVFRIKPALRVDQFEFGEGAGSRCDSTKRFRPA